MISKVRGITMAALVMFLVMQAPVGCKHEPVLKKLSDPGDTIIPNPVDTSICFERDILPLFQTNCSKQGATPGTTPVCHNATYHKEDLHLYNYNGITAEISEVIKNIDNGKMNNTSGTGAYGNLSQAQVNLIKRWINEGMKNVTPCPNICDTAKFTYKATIAVVLGKYCITCHKTGSNPGGGWALDTYTGVKTVADNLKLWGSINKLNGYKPMPMGSSLSACEIKQIEKWIADGAKDN